MAAAKTNIIANQIKNSDTQAMITSVGVLAGIFFGIKKGSGFLGIASYGLIGGISGALLGGIISKFKNN